MTTIARCLEHGLHGERTECFVCGGPVEQVEMVEAELVRRFFQQLDESARNTAKKMHEAKHPENRHDRETMLRTLNLVRLEMGAALAEALGMGE